MAKKYYFTAANTEEAKEALDELVKYYGQYSAEEADYIVALGGDGMMLQTIHAHLNSDIPVYGMNRGSIGFLMNEYQIEDLEERIENAHSSRIHPLVMQAIAEDGTLVEAMALNEVSLFRQSFQAAKLKITIDGIVRMNELICDGVLVATPQGSTAYNYSAQGPIIPLRAPLLALTPLSAFRPRRWKGALIPNQSDVRIEVLERSKRPVNAVADHTEVKSVREVRISEDSDKTGIILFDESHSWEERILKEQFHE